MKDEFINNEIWTLIFGAAFQRANVYKIINDDILKQDFKKATRQYIEKSVLPKYKRGKVKDEAHIASIQAISDFTSKYSKLLKGGKLNFGISQKLLNLYLKYLWCQNKLGEPPHFPVDRRIQERLNYAPVISWTQMTNVEDYMRIITFARENLKSKYNSIAEMELDYFERRIRTS